MKDIERIDSSLSSEDLIKKALESYDKFVESWEHAVAEIDKAHGVKK